MKYKRKIYYENNKEHHKKYREENKQHYKEYREKNKESLKYKRKIYYEKNKFIINIKQKEWQNNNKERVIKRQTQWRNCNKEHLKIYRYENKDNILQQKKLWRENNKDKTRIYYQRYRATKKQLPHTLTTQQWNKIKDKFNNRCAYCSRELPLAQEHFIPLSKGGEYTHNNIIPACISCNSSKRDRDFFEWYPKQDYYSKSREQFILKHLGYKEDKQQLSII